MPQILIRKIFLFFSASTHGAKFCCFVCIFKNQFVYQLVWHVTMDAIWMCWFSNTLRNTSKLGKISGGMVNLWKPLKMILKSFHNSTMKLWLPLNILSTFVTTIYEKVVQIKVNIHIVWPLVCRDQLYIHMLARGKYVQIYNESQAND